MTDKINVFCLPFAGASKYSYKVFEEKAPRHFNIIPIELPGRGSRFKEKLLTDVHLMVDDIFGHINDKLNKPYIIYGHSMGTLLGYLTTLKILRMGLNKPLFLFFTGCAGPSLPKTDPPRYNLPKDKFISMLQEYGGSPDEVLNNMTLFNFFEPILRADFEAMETYSYEKVPAFNIPIYIIIGKDEKVTIEEAQTWQETTTHKVSVEELPGRHFFILDNPQEIINIINQKLNNTYSYGRQTSISKA